MIREILFRGKRIDNGEWVYGDLRQYSEKQIGIYSYELRQTVKGIDPSTVGQYTGRTTDKNGKKIFEGDIVLRFGCRYKVYFDEGKWVLVDRFGFWVELFDDVTYTVIGNIHDNPELLEVEG